MNEKKKLIKYHKKASIKEQLVSFSENILGDRVGEFQLGIKSLPYLADHGFQDMIVLPGSAYTEMALVVYNKIYKKVPGIIKNVKFKNLIILSDEDTVIKVKVTDNVNENVKCEFYEFIQERNGIKPFDNSFTTMELEGEVLTGSEELSEVFVIEQFQDRAVSEINSEEFYRSLYSNGNQYGANFQNISKVWLSGCEALGKLSVSNKEMGIGEHYLHPTLLDSFTQLLSSLSDSKGRTFVLTSIKEIRINNLELSDDLWCYVKLLPNRTETDSEFGGELKVFDSSGKSYLEVFGVNLKYLERLDAEVSADDSKSELCIASTFTADPIEDSLNFWSEYFNYPHKIQLAPYNQIFQELLDPSSLFHNNREGINIILLGLEDWARNKNELSPKINRKEIEKLFDKKSKFTLPNNREIVHLNRYETDYVYKEIFIDKCYLRHGIIINDGDTVIDVGANIGLFTLFVNQHCKNPRIYAYEPSPAVYELLKANCEVYGTNSKTFNYGVSDRKKTAPFTFYQNASVFSSFYANENEDKEAIQSVVRNMLRGITTPETGHLEEYVDEITSGRLEGRSHDVQLLSLSDIIAENTIEEIDLLKIDAEKCELDILRGIGDSDWSKIKQIVIEIHDKSGKILEDVKCLLQEKQFQFAVEEEILLKDSGLYNLYAKKPLDGEKSNSISSEIKYKEKKLKDNCKNFYSALDTFMRVSNLPLIVGVCPRSTNVVSHPELEAMFDEMERKLLSNISEIANVYTIDSLSFQNKYAVDDYYDPYGDELGHIPYTSAFLASIGTTLYRMIFTLQNKFFKVIALDCDNTLWKGVCGEDGALGVQITESFRVLQEFIIDQMNSGRLICLCSKNNEEDVFAVFDKRDDMLLKRDQLVSWRMNWDSKSENLKSLAEELNLGLDSFIFIDDNPIECAEVKINCPEVLTLQLPQNEAVIPKFLKNIWTFDIVKLTEEDKKRTKMYRDNIQREKYRENAITLKDFLDGLKLQINISNATSDQISRVSQLTYRTNQFNLTTIRRSEIEVQNLLNDDQFNCLVAEVSDRFGDYGLVGVLFYKIEDDTLKVDTFLVSCRVLGRGVEHKILSELGQIASEKDVDFIEFNYIPSGKNRPALEFIESIGSKYKKEPSNGLLFKLPTQALKKLKYEPTSLNHSSPELAKIEDKPGKKIESNQRTDIDIFYDKIQKIGDELNDLQVIFDRIEKHKVEEKSSDISEYVEPKTILERKLSLIWQRVLGKTKLGLDDNFFESGGTSLRAVQIIATIKKELDVHLSVIKLFECPTIKLLAAKINTGESSTGISVDSIKAISRGYKRRNKLIIRGKFSR